MHRRAILLLPAIFLGSLPGPGPAKATAAAAPQIGDEAPALGLRDLEDAPVSLPSGRVVIVDFFATWCGPCHQALAALSRLVRDHDASLLIVAVGERREVVAEFFARRPPPPGSRVALDPQGEAARRFGQKRFPTTFLIDRAGRIRHINRGYGPGYEARLDRWLRGLLAATPQAR